MSETKYEGFLDALDVGYNADGGNTVEVVISGYIPAGTLTDKTGKVVERPVVTFARATKAFVLNRTNEKAIILIHGKDREAWKGKAITLTVRFVNNAGHIDLPAVRVQVPKGLPMTFGMRKWQGKAKPSGGAA
jgi:hypothetical protein